VRLQAGRINAGEHAGFTLLEVVCVLAIIALLAAIALPAIPRHTSQPAIEAYALETAALLNEDRDAAQWQHRDVTSVVDARSRTIRSGASGRVLRLPSDVTVHTVLAARCNDEAADGTVRYLASGMSCGGVIWLTRHGVGYQVRVNWLTGGAEVVPVR
jgi:general secretion pathway protein H